ncbi:MAG: HAMP domain-containing protein [Anaerolineales bacterium]|nr:HAMP domain-containing protein [Anaerolineales bacterium]
MTLFRSLQGKLIIAFLLVALTSTAILAGITSRSTQDRFSEYIFNQEFDSLLYALEDFYRTHGTLDGYQAELFPGPPERPNREPFSPSLAFTVTDPYGGVINRQPDQIGGRREPAGEDSQHAPIVVDGELVGFLTMKPSPFEFNQFEQQFIGRIQSTLLVSMFGAMVVAVALGFLLSRSLSEPVKELNRATEAMAAGNLVQRVQVRSRDEIGKLAESFNQMNAKLERMMAQREQMTADIAHELRTPLSVIIGHTSAGKEGILPVDEEMIAVIDDEARHLERLVQDLRTLSLAEAGELTLKRQPAKVAELLNACTAAYLPAGLDKGVKIETTTAENLPELILDTARFKQVINNLIENALRYAPEGSAIELSAEKEGAFVVFSVADAGKGIPAEECERIFDRLYRRDDARARAEGGSGLGLAIVKTLVENHGGDIRVESELGRGTQFLIRLPISDP